MTTIQLDATASFVYTDARALRQITQNMLRNNMLQILLGSLHTQVQLSLKVSFFVGGIVHHCRMGTCDKLVAMVVSPSSPGRTWSGHSQGTRGQRPT